jgi:hypothetical protein
MVSHDIEGTKKYASEILSLGKPLAELGDWCARPGRAFGGEE